MIQASPVMKKASIGFACLNIKVRRSFGVPPYWLLRVAVLINAAVTGVAGVKCEAKTSNQLLLNFCEVSQSRGAVYARG